MNPLSGFLKGLLFIAAGVVGLAMLITIPLAAFDLINFIAGETWLAFFVPAIAAYVFLICVPAGIVHLSGKSNKRPSRTFRLPGPLPLATVAVIVIPVGQLLLHEGRLVPFWPLFILAAALPPLVAVAIASQRLKGITTWRRMTAGLLSGSLLSTHLAIFLTAGVTFLAYLLIVPLRDTWAHVIASKNLEHLFYSPALIWAMIGAAVVAPLVEELTKPLGAILLAKRLKSPAEAFLVGMACGTGFAILENMLYEASGVQVWGGIAAMRAVGGVLHPLNAGLVAMGWYAVRKGEAGAWKRLAGYYTLAVGAHALWNGGLTLLSANAGARWFGTETWQVDIYGLGQPVAIIFFMLVEAIVLWRLLYAVSAKLGTEREARISLSLGLDRPRRLAIWGVAALTVAATVGALYGPLVAQYSDKFLPLG